MSVKWMLPVVGESIHKMAKYHCFENNVSLCGKYEQDQEYFQTDIESGQILMCPHMACQICYKKWKKGFNIGI